MFKIECNKSTMQIIYYCIGKFGFECAIRDAEAMTNAGEYDLRYWQIVFRGWKEDGAAE